MKKKQKLSNVYKRYADGTEVQLTTDNPLIQALKRYNEIQRSHDKARSQITIHTSIGNAETMDKLFNPNKNDTTK